MLLDLASEYLPKWLDIILHNLTISLTTVQSLVYTANRNFPTAWLTATVRQCQCGCHVAIQRTTTVHVYTTDCSCTISQLHNWLQLTTIWLIATLQLYNFLQLIGLAFRIVVPSIPEKIFPISRSPYVALFFFFFLKQSRTLSAGIHFIIKKDEIWWKTQIKIY